MIPQSLKISGFLSYRDAVEIDLTNIELACIAGANGAGKSSLLDSITWALFGQARKRDDSVINAQSNTAEVRLTFEYEGNLYRVQRTKPRDKTAQLEFHIAQHSGAVQTGLVGNGSSTYAWKPLTERTLRETELRIQDTLRLDYETFVNAAFFLQGKADQFTQQRPGDRKRILGSILGLEVWESYRQRAADRRKGVEAEIAGLDGRLREIGVELGEEGTRRVRLAQLESDLERVGVERSAQETNLETLRLVAASLARQREMAETLGRQVEAAQRRLNELEVRLNARCDESAGYSEIIGRSQEVEAAYAAWQADQVQLEELERVAAQFREYEKRRQAPRDEINAARTRLETELSALKKEAGEVRRDDAEIARLAMENETVQQALVQNEAQLEKRTELEGQRREADKLRLEARIENPRLKAEMDELRNRLDQLKSVDGAACPLCGQPLSPEERQKLMEEITARGIEMRNRYRANESLLKEYDGKVKNLETEITQLNKAEGEHRSLTTRAATISSQMALLASRQEKWANEGSMRIAEVESVLKNESYAQEARAQLAQVDAELREIGYDAVEHDATRRRVQEGKSTEEAMRMLERARAALAPLQREITDMQKEAGVQRADLERQEAEYHLAFVSVSNTQVPDVDAAEGLYFQLQEQENRLRMEVGAARQKVLVLDDLKDRRKSLEKQRENLAAQVGQYKQLERAFSKDGVPALLIEQALPEIETRANEILDRLSGGAMSVRFVTQSAYKDKKRDDLRETLDIQISDAAGVRDLEMFSGGESFRVNFAIRLALSEVLAQRAGARLRTLVIDEGFGSQDAIGRQRLIEAINLVRQDFSKILVITHIDELKDAFPNRIEVEKTDRGSTVRVV